MKIKIHQLKPDPRKIDLLKISDDIFVSVKIGNGQKGGNFFVNPENDEVFAKGDLSEPTFLGKASKLNGLALESENNVLDVNQFTNNCVITTTFLNQDSQVLFSKIDLGAAPENGVASFQGKYLFKILSLLLFLMLGYANTSLAQTGSDEVKFNELQTPSSPGFILFDDAPSAIEKPSTPQGFGLSLLGLQQSGGAIEVAPYWLMNHPNLTAESMIENKNPVLQHFSLSLASIKSDTADYYAVGFRTRLFQSYGDFLKKKLDTIDQLIVEALSVRIADLDHDKIEELRAAYVDITENPVFSIDLAGAIGSSSKTNSFDDLVRNRSAFWLAMNWRPKGDDFYTTALIRYMDNEKFEGYASPTELIDIGLRFNYDINELSISLESLLRMNSMDENYTDYRIAAIGTYKINEKLYFTSTLGKNFTEVNNIIALAGVNFGFSKNEVKAFN